MMTEHTEDVGALTKWLYDWRLVPCEHGNPTGAPCSTCLSRRLLASDWLAARDARLLAGTVPLAYHDDIVGQANKQIHALEAATSRLRHDIEALADGWERVAGTDRDVESRTLRGVAIHLRAVLAAERDPEAGA